MACDLFKLDDYYRVTAILRHQYENQETQARWWAGSSGSFHYLAQPARRNRVILLQEYLYESLSMKEIASSKTKEKTDGLKRRDYVGDGSGERKREVRKGEERAYTYLGASRQYSAVPRHPFETFASDIWDSFAQWKIVAANMIRIGRLSHSISNILRTKIPTVC